MQRKPEVKCFYIRGYDVTDVQANIWTSDQRCFNISGNVKIILIRRWK